MLRQIETKSEDKKIQQDKVSTLLILTEKLLKTKRSLPLSLSSSPSWTFPTSEYKN